MDEMIVHELLRQYEGRMGEMQAGLEHARFHSTLAASVLAIAFALFLMFCLLAVRQQISFLWLSLPIPLAAVSARRFQRYRHSQSRMWRLQRFYDRAVQRVQGTWMGGGTYGEGFNDPGHVYAGDLNVFGEGSLFELLCTARTAIGQRGLAGYLLKAPAVEETLLRQEAVRELRGQVDLRERVALLGKFEFLESKWETFAEWLDLPVVSFSRTLRIAVFLDVDAGCQRPCGWPDRAGSVDQSWNMGSSACGVSLGAWPALS